MRVIVWGINYAPEQTGIGPYNAALCEFLVKRGHEIEMVTGFEYYPDWRKKAEDAGCFYRTDLRGGVTVRRCWLYVPTAVRALKRIAHELSFVVTSLLRVIALRRPDAFIVVSPPLLLGLAGAIARFFKRAPLIFHIQDLQPDAAVRLGMLRGDRGLAKILYGLESLIYKCADRISAISPGIVRSLHGKGVPERKIIYFPNGVSFPSAFSEKGRFRARHGIDPETFIVLYSGNLGLKQGLGVLVDAASLVHGREQKQSSPPLRRVLFVIAGTGASRGKLVERVAAENLDNILMLPLQPEEAYREMLVDADCCAITQQTGTGALFFPSKLLTTLAFAKPVLSIADEESDLAAAVKVGGFGVNILPGSPEAVVDAVAQWTLPETDLAALGKKGSDYVSQFEMQEVLIRFEENLHRLIQPQTLANSLLVSPSAEEREGLR